MNSLKAICNSRGSNYQLAIRCFSSSNVVCANEKTKVLIIGGGAGGCAVGAKLTYSLGAGKVTILEPADTHYYQPYLTLIGGGMQKLENAHKPMKDVLPTLAKWVKDKAEKFDPKTNTVTTKNGDVIEYEYLIVAAGLQVNYDQIPGLEKALEVKGGPVCSIYSPKYANTTFAALQNFRSGNAIFTFPDCPVKCAGAPQKICYISDQYLRKNKKRQNAQFIYNTSMPVLFTCKHYADALWPIVRKRDINVNLRTNLVEILPNGKQAVFENLDTKEKTTIDFELLHVTPPMGTPDELKYNSGDLVNEAGFVEVDSASMRHVRYPNVFGLGDCSNSPTSKTAAAAAAQSQVVYKNLSAVMEGRKPTHVYDGYTSCPIVTSYSTVMLAEFDYSVQPKESFPIDQAKERYSMFAMKRYFMAPLYWHLMLNGIWNGPGFIRKAFNYFK